MNILNSSCNFKTLKNELQMTRHAFKIHKTMKHIKVEKFVSNTFIHLKKNGVL